MSDDSEEKQTFDRIYGEILNGIIAGNPGGAIGKRPNEFTDLAATIALAGVKSRAAALEQLPKSNITPVATPGLSLSSPGSYAGPVMGGALPAAGTAFTPATPVGTPIAGAPAVGAAGATPADRTARLGISQEVCPVCKGMRNEPSRTQDAQCPIFHFQPHGNLVPNAVTSSAAGPPATAAPSGPIQPIVTGPTAPISTG